jgi:ribonuclease BN (tRNA processing enzyme)
MVVSLQMLGTGSAFSKKLYHNNALLYSGEQKWMIDCGYLATRSLQELKISLNEITGIIITHLHADHIGGLEEVAFRMKYEYHHRATLYIPSGIRQDLWEHSLKGGLENKQDGFIALDDYFKVIELTENQLVYLNPNLFIEIIHTVHVPGKLSYSLFIQNDLFYSSDIQFMPEFILNEVVGRRKCTTILHDCQLDGTSEVHATLHQLLTLPDHIQSKIYLMHYGDHMSSYIGETGMMKFIEQHQIYSFGLEGESS